MTERQTLSILYYLRRDKKNKKDEAPVYLRITVNGKRSEMATNRYVDPDKWNHEGGYVKGNKTEYKALNEYLDILRSKVYQAQRELIEGNKLVTAEALRNKIQGKTGIQKTLLEVFEYHNHLIKEQVPGQYSPATLTKYKTTLDHIRNFVKYKFQKEDLYLNELNHEFVTSLEHYLKTILDQNHNTAIKYIKNLRKVIHLAVKNDWLVKDPFIHFSVRLKEVKKDYLDEHELTIIESVGIASPRLGLVRDIFIFSCYTGLAYKDVKLLTPDNVRIGIDGEQWIFTERIKTDTKSNIPLLPKALEIIEKYKEYPENVIEGRLLPVISNQKMNLYLKEIAKLAGIKKTLTFHLARHTFATTVTLANGVPIESVSEMLGHKSMRTTQIYAKVIDKKVSEDMGKLKEKLINKNKLTKQYKVKK